MALYNESFFFRGVRQFVKDQISLRRAQETEPESRIHHCSIEIFAANPNPLIGPPAPTTSYSKVLPYDTYTTSDNAAAPILGDVKITLDGDYMTLKRAEFSATVTRNQAAFEDIEQRLLFPGAPIKIKYKSKKYVGEGSYGEFEGQVYDYSFAVKPGGVYELSVKAVGKGYPLLEANVNATAADVMNINFKGLEFVSNYTDKQVSPVKTIFDYIDYDLQKSFGKLPGQSERFDVPNGSAVHGKSSTSLDYSHASLCVLDIDPDLYVHAQGIKYDKTMWTSNGSADNNKIAYVTLQYLTWLVNTFIKPYGGDRYEIICDAKTTIGNTMFTHGDNLKTPIFSSEPLTIGIVTSTYVDVQRPRVVNGVQTTVASKLIVDHFVDPTITANIANFPGKREIGFTRQNGTGINNSNRLSVRTDDLGNQYNLSGILISRDYLRGLQASTMSESNGQMSVEKMFNAIFDTISNATGGAIKLFLVKDDDTSTASVSRWQIRNRFEPPGQSRIPILEFSPLDGITKEYSMTAKVPKDIAAAAFGGAPGSNNASAMVARALQGTSQDFDNGISHLPTTQDIADLKYRIIDDGFDGASKTDLMGLLTRLVSDEPAKLAGEKRMIPFPLELELTLHGIEGLRHGDTISFDPSRLPNRYKVQYSGQRLVFTIVRIEHIFSSAGKRNWYTNVISVPRLVTQSKVNTAETRTKDL